ncbi:MAG TPA: VOC family protein [Dehalococcoidia bacterium]|jgi:catechol 2,3-dioxygenase-like lactoylglutathione lyase family enzyme
MPDPAPAAGDRPARVASIDAISALTLATRGMARSVAFYRALGFVLHYGGETASFSSFYVGASHLNLIAVPPETRLGWWGRAIFYVSDVDALHAQALAAGLQPETAPADAPWGERFFHILDPDGHELSFAQPIVAHD